MREIVASVLLILSVAGVMISTIVSPVTKGVLASVDVLPGTLSNRTEIVCTTDCNRVCEYSNGVVTPGMVPCWTFGRNVTDGPVLCVGKSVCCATNNDHDCLSILYSPVCRVTCEVHTILHGTAIAKHSWLLTGGPTFSFHYDCGPLPATDETQCVPPRFMRPPRYFMPLPLFVLLIVSIATLVVATCLLCVAPSPSQEERPRHRSYYTEPTAPVARVL